MVIAQYRVSWLGDADLGMPFEVQQVDEVKGKWGPEFELILMNEHGETRRMSCFGANQNFMISNYGPDTDKWRKAVIKVEKEERPWKNGETKVLKLIRKASF